MDRQYKLIRRAQQQLHLLRVLMKIHLLIYFYQFSTLYSVWQNNTSAAEIKCAE